MIEVENLFQFQIEELDQVEVQYLLSEIIESRFFDASKAEKIAHHIYGHPATAQYAAAFYQLRKEP